MSRERYFEASTSVCPSCETEVTEFQYFPRVRIKSVKAITPSIHLNIDSENKSRGSYDFGKAIGIVFKTDGVQKYLETLKSYEGLVVVTSSVLPPEEVIGVDCKFPWDAEEKMQIDLDYDKPKIAVVSLRGIFGKAGYSYYSVHADIAKFRFDGLFLAPQLPIVER